MDTISIVITILVVSICILLAIVVYNNATRWVAAVILPMLCLAGYLGWNSADDLRGKPTKKLYNDDAMFLGSTVDMPNYIYVWIQPLGGAEPILISMPFSQKLAAKMAQANKDMCEGKPQGVRPGDADDSDEDADDRDEQAKGKTGAKTMEIYEFNIRINPVK